jgi:hypothetical protein
VESWADGSHFQGSYQDGKKHGKGTISLLQVGTSGTTAQFTTASGRTTRFAATDSTPGPTAVATKALG